MSLNFIKNGYKQQNVLDYGFKLSLLDFMLSINAQILRLYMDNNDNIINKYFGSL